MAIPYTTSIDLLTGNTPQDSAGVTADKTGEGYDVSKRQQITVQFLCTHHTAGNGVFTIDVSDDGVNWVTGVAVRDMSSTTPATYVTSVTLSSNTSRMVKVTPGYRYVRAVVDVTTDGTYFAFLEAGG